MNASPERAQEEVPEEWLRSVIRAACGDERQWSVYIKDLSSGAEAGLSANVQVDTMSVIKIPLLLCLLQLSEAGGVDLDQRVVISAERKRFGTGVLSTLDMGAEISLRDAATLMITVSDNAATDIVFEAVGGYAAVNDAMTAAGLTQIRAIGTTFDWFRSLATSMNSACAEYTPGELFEKGYPVPDHDEFLAARARYHFEGGVPLGVGTARQFGILLESLARGEYVNRGLCDEALRILAMQTNHSRIPRYLPPSSTIHHKTGDFTPFIANDAGIVRRSDGRMLVLCMFSRGNTASWGFLEEVVSRVALEAYKEMNLARPFESTKQKGVVG